ncbi:fungal-specific transcription factor domain-containing protein [Cantharellus anzutake]|uniref:fungal-specific transcription factor domain-containing protein n=1 Tax=Cantharellus anzutake TaxID=1750568 RepID=UPI001907373A|nr:fungal-specific transcription factor domain-containing protein [Cantharellus anzutake]KAF8332083.1 fungal-specific transcription factor domain-containing protein [Cantharellus anzutake]
MPSSSAQNPAYPFLHDSHLDTNYHSDDSSFSRRPQQRLPYPHPSPISPSRAPYPAHAPHASSSRPGSVHIVDSLQPPSIDPPPPQKKRPKYTRSKAGCLTCRSKKIKCDEVKPICTRCDHAQRECTWPTETQRKKIPRRVRSSNSPDAGPGLPAVPSNAGPYSALSAYRATPDSTSSASEDTGSTVSGTYDDGIGGLSGSESGDDYGRMAGSGYLDQSYLPQTQTHLVGAYQNLSLYPNQTNVYRTGQQHNLDPDVSGSQPPGIDYNSVSVPALSVTSSPSQVSTAGSPNQMYPQIGPPQLYPPNLDLNQPTLNLDSFNFPQLPPLQPQHTEPKWNSYSPQAINPPVTAGFEYPYNSGADAHGGDEHASGTDYESEQSNAPLSPPEEAPSPEEAALAGYSSAGVPTTTGNEQWNNAPAIVNSAPDPIEPFFKTLKERELIHHYAGSSTELIMAVNTSAGLNPVLATTLPIVLSVLPRTSAPVEALRLSLLGVAAIHQSSLHSHSNSNRQLLEKSTVTKMREAKKGAPLSLGLLGDEGDQEAAENLRLALLLRQNASQCLYFAYQSLEGSLHDAALAASVSIALIDIFAGGNDFESNLALAKQLIAIRGGPENIIANNAPVRTSFGGGVTVSPARLLLEIIAVYDAFGSLTTGEEPAYLGHGDVRWWLDGDDWNYHKYSVEKKFGMSRTCIHLVAKVSTLLSRLSAVEGTESFTGVPPNPKNVSANALNLHAEATALLARLDEEANSDAARATRFMEIGSDEGTATGGRSRGGGGFGANEQPPPNASPDYPQTTAKRIEHGTQAHLLAFQIVLLRLVFHVDRHDRRVQFLANEIITRCHASATLLQMPIDLTWPVIIAASELDVQKRGLVSEIFEGFRKKCCYDIDTAEQIVNRVWQRVDQNQPRANWKSVLEDDKTRVLLI